MKAQRPIDEDFERDAKRGAKELQAYVEERVRQEREEGGEEAFTARHVHRAAQQACRTPIPH
jgi:hypothetical protein